MSAARVLASGGFDPLHEAHVRYLRAAAELGELTVALNTDAWLARKKGFVFQPWAARAEIVGAIKGVSCVVTAQDDDGTVCATLRDVHPDIFAKGGASNPGNVPEMALCRELGIRIAFLGHYHPVHSSELAARLRANRPRVMRQWGWYEVLAESEIRMPGWKVKLLHIEPGKSTSLQRHFYRSERWIALSRGEFLCGEKAYTVGSEESAFVLASEWHQLLNPFASPFELIEVQTGTYLGEDDIERAA